MMNQKLSFFGIIKEIPNSSSSPSSLPSLNFCFLLFIETNCQQTFITAIKSKLEPPAHDHYPFDGGGNTFEISYLRTAFDVLIELITNAFLPLMLPGFLYLGIVHLLHLINTIVTVHSASMIYAGEGTVHLKEFLGIPFRGVGLKGPLMTSVYAFVLTSLTLIGILSLSTHFFTGTIFVFMVVVRLVIIAFLVKYLEWSAIWNMGMVISILEKKHGDVAISVSVYINRGSRKCGFVLMLVFTIRNNSWF